MSSTIEPTSVGLSQRAQVKLLRLRDDGHFHEATDAYRFAISLALAYGVIPDEIVPPKVTIYNISTIDQNNQIYTAISALFDTGGTSVYKWAERLAEWGVDELDRCAEAGEIDFGALLAKVEKAAG